MHTKAMLRNAAREQGWDVETLPMQRYIQHATDHYKRVGVVITVAWSTCGSVLWVSVKLGEQWRLLKRGTGAQDVLEMLRAMGKDVAA